MLYIDVLLLFALQILTLSFQLLFVFLLISLDFIKLSGTNNIDVDAEGFPVDSTQFDSEGLSLNGYIQGLKVFDKALSNSEVALVI